MTAVHAATDQADTLRQLAHGAKKPLKAAQLPPERLRVISVTSARGGVGKSSVVANLAWALARQGGRVLMVDADLERGDLCLLSGVKPMHTLVQVISGEKRLEEIVVPAGKGIDILPAGLTLQQYQSLTPSGRAGLLQGLERLQRRYDLILIDTGKGITANVTSFAGAAREIMLVVTPEATSITDAYAMVKTLAGRDGTLSFRLLVNQCREAEQGEALFRKLEAITARFLQVSMDYSGCILQDQSLNDSFRRQETLGRHFPDAPASLGFRALAQHLTSEGPHGVASLPLDQVVQRKEWRNHELSS